MVWLKRLLTDMLGVCLLVLAILFGWLPGPGGIPLFVAGLSLLAINHRWARRWLQHVKRHGINLSQKIFRDHPLWRLAIDVLSTALFSSGVWLFSVVTRSLWRGLAISMVCLGIGLFLGNRHRLEDLLRHFKAQAK